MLSDPLLSDVLLSDVLAARLDFLVGAVDGAACLSAAPVALSADFLCFSSALVRLAERFSDTSAVAVCFAASCDAVAVGSVVEAVETDEAGRGG